MMRGTCLCQFKNNRLLLGISTTQSSSLVQGKRVSPRRMALSSAHRLMGISNTTFQQVQALTWCRPEPTSTLLMVMATDQGCLIITPQRQYSAFISKRLRLTKIQDM